MLINIAAYFDVCTCRRHGRIVTSGGRTSVELGSKEKARRALSDGVEKKMIDAVEAKYVSGQINDSSLPECEGNASSFALLTAHLTNHIHGAEEGEFWIPEPSTGASPTYVN